MIALVRVAMDAFVPCTRPGSEAGENERELVRLVHLVGRVFIIDVC